MCDSACVADLEKKERRSTPSGLQYIDIVEGTGSFPPVGYQVVVNYVSSRRTVPASAFCSGDSGIFKHMPHCQLDAPNIYRKFMSA